MENCNKVCISLSGGLDSTCLLLELLSKGYEVRAYGFDYGQKHSIELTKVEKNIKLLQDLGCKVTHQVINLRDVFSDSASSLHTGGEKIPEGHYADESMKSTVVEQRNIIFSAVVYGKALSWSKKSNSNVLISLGLHSGDHAIYPDCRPESQEMAKELFRISNWGSERVDYDAPFININKGEVLHRGLMAMDALGISKDVQMEILKNTHSCYAPDSEGRACGKCGTCVERLEAFEQNNLKDPVEYI